MLKPPLSRVPPGLSHVSTAGASEPVGAAARVDSHGSAEWPRRLGKVRSEVEPTSRAMAWTVRQLRRRGGACGPRHFHSIAAGGACFKPRGVLHTRSPQATKEQRDGYGR